MPANKSWHDYNESLIERGRVLIDLDFIRSSNEEIMNMNKDKVGAPFQYSDNYIQFLAFLDWFQDSISYCSGKVRVDYQRVCKKNWRDTLYTYHRRRILKIKPSICWESRFSRWWSYNTYCWCIRSHNFKERWLHIEDKWKREKKKEFVKLHISVDEKSKKVEYHLG